MIRLLLVLTNLLFAPAALALVAGFLLSRRRGLLAGLAGELAERSGRPEPEGLRSLAGRTVVWVHAASAGEVGAAAPLLERLRALPEAPAVVLTATTAAGRLRARKASLGDAALLAPADCAWAVGRFLEAVRPRLLIIVETELWPNLLGLSSLRGVPAVLVNGRLTQRSFRRYRLVRPFVAALLGRLELLAVQTEEDAERFRGLGADPARIKVTGNLKHDLAAAAQGCASAVRALEKLGWKGRPLLVAGSTHPGEEEQVLEAFRRAKDEHPRLRLVIAPRHVERTAGLAAAVDGAGLRGVLLSRLPQGPGGRDADCLILDALGVLAGFYPFAFASFVGGTLARVGGHNLLEPAAAGSPVLFGPHTSSTAETARRLEQGGGGCRVADAAALSAALLDLLGDPARAAQEGSRARRTAEGLRGATQRTWELLRPLLPPRAP